MLIRSQPSVFCICSAFHCQANQYLGVVLYSANVGPQQFQTSNSFSRNQMDQCPTENCMSQPSFGGDTPWKPTAPSVQRGDISSISFRYRDVEFQCRALDQ